MPRKVELNGIPLEIVEEGEVVEGAIILVSRKVDNPLGARGSTEERCDWCGEVVWLHSSSRECAPGAKLKCSQCFIAAIKQEAN